MYSVSWGLMQWVEDPVDSEHKHEGKKKSGGKTFTSIELALVCFINHDTSPKWDWVTLELDKTV